MSDDGYPILEATIYINKKKVVLVDSGNFSVKCKINDTLKFSAWGFFSKTIIVQDSSFLTVKLQKDTNATLCVSVVYALDFYKVNFLVGLNKNFDFSILLSSRFFLKEEFFLNRLYFGFGYVGAFKQFSVYLRFQTTSSLLSFKRFLFFKPFFDVGIYSNIRKISFRYNVGAYLFKTNFHIIKDFYLNFLVETRLEKYQLNFLFGISLRRYRASETGYTIEIYKSNIVKKSN